MSPAVLVKPAAEMPPAKVEVPVVVTSRVPVRVRLVAAKFVVSRVGILEVPVVVTSSVPSRVKEVVLILVAVRFGKVEVPKLVIVSLPADWISPAVIVRPASEEIPPTDFTRKPLSNVEVAAPET